MSLQHLRGPTLFNTDLTLQASVRTASLELSKVIDMKETNLNHSLQVNTPLPNTAESVTVTTNGDVTLVAILLFYGVWVPLISILPTLIQAYLNQSWSCEVKATRTHNGTVSVDFAIKSETKDLKNRLKSDDKS